MSKIKLLVVATVTMSALSANAQARPVSRVLPPMVMAGDYIRFTKVENNIDCTNLGGPLFAGDFVSEVGTIEVDSSVNLIVNYRTGPDLKSGPSSIPTIFQFAVGGLASFDGQAAPSPENDGYTKFGALPNRTANQTGSIEFPATPNLAKGLRARVIAQRSNLRDHAGEYATQITLSWAKW